MPNTEANALDSAQLPHRALSRWANEGGAPLGGHRESLSSDVGQSEVLPLTNAEVVQLRVRVIALENLIISLLAQSSDRQLELVRAMAAYICPRPGCTQHPLTIHAAAQMIQLVERAGHFREQSPS